jgi:hypothetical protein
MSDGPQVRSADGSVRHGVMVGVSDLPALDLNGADLSFIRIDRQTRLQFSGTEVVIATPFRLVVDGVSLSLDPGVRHDLGPLLAVYPTTLVTAEIDDDLSLRLTFEGGTTVEVPQDQQYEAWSIVGPGSRLIVCPPSGGGTLAVWS